MHRLTVTNYRVRYAPNPQQNEHQLKSIMLEHITSAAISSISNPGLIVIGAVLFSGGVLTLAVAPKLLPVSAIAIAVGFLLGLIFFLTRHNEILIASPTISIRCKIEKKSFSECEELLDKIENAINNRYISRTFTSQVYKAG